MANKSLTDLTARTATADSDLIHVNSGGTDYKETKRDFLQGDLYITFANDSTLTSQVGALPVGTFFGKLNGYGHQSETGMPANANWIVRATRYAISNCILDAWPVGNADLQYRITQSSSTWESSWTKLPQRSEITSLNNSLANITEWHYTDEIKANGWASNGISVYGKIGNLGFIQASMRNGTINSNLMTLPSGFRPSGVVVVLIVSYSGVNGYAVINTNGTVIPSAMTTQAAIFNAIYPIA